MDMDNVFDKFLFPTDTSMHTSDDVGLDDDDDSVEDGGDADDKKRKRARGQHRSMTEEQKVERRERNREHAKRSRVRKKFLLESLQQSVNALKEENNKLKLAIREHLADEAEELLGSNTLTEGSTVLAEKGEEASRTLDDPDYGLVKALQTAQQNFVITDPALPDNPIVYASQGFLGLTGYVLDQVLGRNCRFLQGPDTDPKSVDKIRKGIENGEDTTVVLLNYRVDGSTFWNQFFIAALRDGEGNIVNYLGVQCKVSDEYAKAFEKNGGLV
jgi:PAS domain S-box-containing protein